MAWMVANIVNTCGHVEETVTVKSLLNPKREKRVTQATIDAEKRALIAAFPGMYKEWEREYGNHS